MANFSRTDLDFLYQQILISESDSSAQMTGTFNALPGLVGDPLLPHGLRNVDGSYNNLLPGQSLFGSADQIFPRLLDPFFLAGENVPSGFGTPNQPAGSATSYDQTRGLVFDTQPRLISNLISDLTASNPAAVTAAANTPGSGLVNGTRVDGTVFQTYFIPNVTTDAGLSAPFNSWFTLFGQFFDHGLDLVNKGKSGTVFVPLRDDDPLVAGPDGILGDDPNTFIDESLDDSPGANLAVYGDDPTTPGVDESQDDTPGAEAFFGDDPNTFIDESLDDSPGADLAVYGDDPTTPGVDESQDDTPGAEAFFGDDPNTLDVDESLDDSPGTLLASFGDNPYTALDESQDDTSGAESFYGDDPNTFIDESLDDSPGTLLATYGDNPYTASDESLDDDPGPDGILGDDPTTFIDESLDDLPAHLRFMTLTRATNLPGPDGITGDNPATPLVDESADDIHEHRNQTTPFVDQNQTYTSHPSHQVFLREYEINAAGNPVSTGRLLDGSGSLKGLPTWADIKAQAQAMLGIHLTDADVTDLPLLATDSYGQFIPGPNGYAQIVTASGLVEGDPSANGGLGVDIPSDTMRTGHAFLDDIAHSAAPRNSNGTMKTPDGDNIINPGPAAAGQYDDELLDAHFITGDGRGNENIGLTTVHTVFHAEHNRTVDFVKDLITNSGDNAFIAQWKLADGSWDGERLFQAARFATEMQYQHLVFEEFARKVQPNVDVFIGYDSTIDPAIMAEFAHVVYRFGHSMLTETVARTNPDGTPNDIGLIQAFLNPVEFGADYADNFEAAAAVVNGMTKQVGNEIDEFVTEALRNNLVGLPLDLATINLTRGRDTGVPSLNEARRMFYEDTGHSSLIPYESWADFGLALRHPESLVNFVAAYGNHPSITSAATMVDKRAAAELLVNGGAGAPADRSDFMNGTGGYTTATSGLDSVDFWIGGLAEKQAPFGGLLGSTFNFVFETQMESLQNGDRLYYLARTAGLDFLTQLEENSFAEMIMRNLPGVKHLPFDVFSTPTYSFEASAQGSSGPIVDDPDTPYDERTLLIRDNSLGSNTIRYTGEDHVVMGGTGNNDKLRTGAGDDTIWGDGGNDRIEGGDGNDALNGGDGNDIITDSSGDDNIKGGDGHDVINGGAGINLLLGGAGSDFIVTGSDISEVFAGPGNDFVFGNAPNEVMTGNEGDDWIQAGTGDGSPGDNGDPFGRDPIRGNDVFIGSGNIDSFEGEGGDDIMNGMNGADKNIGSSGFDWTVSVGNTNSADIDLARLIFPGPFVDTVDRYKFVEAASGWNQNDTIRGDDSTSVELEFVDPVTGQNNALDNVNNPAGGGHSAADRIALINGLSTLLNGAASFSSGNILLGGGGSDLIEGRAGDDIIDGDAWLNVRISVRDLGDGHEVASFDNMTSTLRAAMQAGTYRPDQLKIVREIKYADSGIDTAVYQDTFANYILTFSSNGTLFIDHAIPNGNGGGNDDGSDTVRNIERIQFADRMAFIGTLGNDNLTGTANNDSLYGLAGNDILDGLGGIDTLTGGQGDDTYVVDTTTDIIVEFAAQGIDTIQSAVNFSLDTTVNIENLTLTGAALSGTGTSTNNVLTGNSLNNTLSGLGGDDILNGLDGIDTLLGGTGNDIFVVDTTTDTITELSGQGSDTVQSSVTYTLGAQLENLTLTGANAINGTGNSVANILTGNSANNLLTGLSGSDTLNGLEGVDTLAGGTGSDIYEVDTVTDTITELAGEGTDLVRSSVTFSLIANVENLTLTGTDAVDGTGTGAANVLTGNSANNILAGLGGNDTLNGSGGVDTLIGGTGNDTYEVDTTTDTLTELSGEGTDLVRSLVTFTLAANFENLTLTGTGAVNGTGNNAANTLTGNGNNNVLNGSGGNDTLNGLDGADTLDGGSGTDNMNGGAGNDTLIGGVNADTLTGSGGIDTFVYAVLAHSNSLNRDTITDFVHTVDKIDLSALDANTTSTSPGNDTFVFIGGAAFSGAGQVRYDAVTGLLEANVNANLAADLQIQLTGAPQVDGGDLIL